MPVFLFTDIENSTRLWEEHRAAMGEVLSRHDALLTACVVAHGGRVVKHLGDGVFAAFGNGEPLACAVEIQKRMAAENWGDVAELRVRVAIHAGDAEERDGDFFGPAVNRTTRLLNVGWGGQILFTPEAAQAAALPAGGEVADLGVHLLRDFAEPQRIYQLLHPDLPDREFPPLRTRPERPHNLPPQPTPFVGRETELAAVASLLADPTCRLLTLVGPGGVGKTRLALQAASAALDGFEWGVYFVSLAPLSDADLIVAAVADALKFAFYGRETPKTQLWNYLREKELLLVMDNFEHLVPGAEVVADILREAPRVKVLATSRERLRLRGERICEVRGLPFPAGDGNGDLEDYGAVRLFLQGARRVHPAFVLASAERPYLARICRVVEGVPLGLELAASWVRAITIPEIAAEVERDPDFLAADLRDLPERHQSLRTVFEYSWRLLSDDEKAALARLSICEGGFEGEAAERVTGASLRVLSGLADKSLLRRDVDGRYAMLEIVRQYAEEKLTAHEGEETRDRHAAYYADFLTAREDALRGDEQKKALDEIAAEIENVRGAWSWATARGNVVVLGGALQSLFVFYETRLWFSEGVDAFARTVERLQAMRGQLGEGAATLADVLARVRTRLGWLYFRVYNYPKAEEQLTQSLAHFRARGNRAEAALALNWLGFHAHRSGAYVTARHLYNEALEFFRGLGDRAGVATALEHLGNVAFRLGEYAEAERLYGDSLTLNRTLKNRRGIASALSNLGDVANALGEFAKAQGLCEESLAIQRLLGFQLGVAGSLNNLGDVARAQGDYGRAEGLYEESLAIQKEIGNRWGAGLAVESLGGVAHDRGDYDRAAKLYMESLSVREEIGDRRGSASSKSALGDVAYARGDYAEARRLYEQSLALQREIGDRTGVAKSLQLLGDVAIVHGDYPGARLLYEESLALRREIGDRLGVATTLNHLANVAYSLGEYDDAKRLYNDSLALSRRIGYRRGVSYALNNLGDVHESLGEYDEAITLYEESLAIDREIGDRRGIAVSLNNLGIIRYRRGEYEAARPLLEEGLALCRDLGYREGIAFCSCNLGNVAVAAGGYEAADKYFRTALKTAAALRAVPSVMEAFVGLAALFLKKDRFEEAAELLSFAIRHPSSEQANKDRAAQLLTAMTPGTQDELVAAAREKARTRTWEDLAREHIPPAYLVCATSGDAARAEDAARRAGIDASVVAETSGPAARAGVAVRVPLESLPDLAARLRAEGFTDFEVVEDY